MHRRYSMSIHQANSNDGFNIATDFDWDEYEKHRNRPRPNFHRLGEWIEEQRKKEFRIDPIYFGIVPAENPRSSLSFNDGDSEPKHRSGEVVEAEPFTMASSAKFAKKICLAEIIVEDPVEVFEPQETATAFASDVEMAWETEPETIYCSDEGDNIFSSDKASFAEEDFSEVTGIREKIVSGNIDCQQGLAELFFPPPIPECRPKPFGLRSFHQFRKRRRLLKRNVSVEDPVEVYESEPVENAKKFSYSSHQLRKWIQDHTKVGSDTEWSEVVSAKQDENDFSEDSLEIARFGEIGTETQAIAVSPVFSQSSEIECGELPFTLPRRHSFNVFVEPPIEVYEWERTQTVHGWYCSWDRHAKKWNHGRKFEEFSQDSLEPLQSRETSSGEQSSSSHYELPTISSFASESSDFSSLSRWGKKKDQELRDFLDQMADAPSLEWMSPDSLNGDESLPESCPEESISLRTIQQGPPAQQQAETGTSTNKNGIVSRIRNFLVDKFRYKAKKSERVMAGSIECNKIKIIISLTR